MEGLIKFETAQKAKDKGFDIACWDYLSIYGEQDEIMGYIGDNFEDKYELAKDSVDIWLPSQSVLAKWLREQHKLHIMLWYVDEIIGFQVSITDMKNNNVIIDSIYNISFEEAFEEGLFEALKFIRE